MTIRIDPSVLTDVEELAAADGRDAESWVNDVLSRVVKDLRDQAYWRERAKNADLDAALIFLESRTGDPLPGDEWPADWSPEKIASFRGW